MQMVLLDSMDLKTPDSDSGDNHPNLVSINCPIFSDHRSIFQPDVLMLKSIKFDEFFVM